MSATWDASYWVSWIYVCSVFSLALEPDLYAWWDEFNFFSPCLDVQSSRVWEREITKKKKKKKATLNASDVNSSVLSIRSREVCGHIFFHLPFLTTVLAEALYYTLHPLPNSTQTVLYISWFHPYISRQHPYILPRMYVPGSTTCAYSSHALVWLGGSYSAILVYWSPAFLS